MKEGNTSRRLCPRAMGNLLRVLYNRDDSPAKVDIFVDFESKYHTIWVNDIRKHQNNW